MPSSHLGWQPFQTGSECTTKLSEKCFIYHEEGLSSVRTFAETVWELDGLTWWLGRFRQMVAGLPRINRSFSGLTWSKSVHKSGSFTRRWFARSSRPSRFSMSGVGWLERVFCRTWLKRCGWWKSSMVDLPFPGICPFMSLNWKSISGWSLVSLPLYKLTFGLDSFFNLKKNIICV